MPAITTYVCDVTGFSSDDPTDFANIQLSPLPSLGNRVPYFTENKIISLAKARELGFVGPVAPADEPLTIENFVPAKASPILNASDGARKAEVLATSPTPLE